MAEINDPIAVVPTIMDAHGKAWRLDLDKWSKSGGIRRDAHAGIASWIVEAPFAHPFWHSYIINLIHLRPVAGLSAPQIYLAGATHEIFVNALDPAKDRRPTVDCVAPPYCLTPCNFAGQFIEPNDQSAIERAEEAVRDICRGTLSPDTDFVSQWIARFGAANVIKHGSLH